MAAARSWARWAEDRGNWPEAAQAYRHATTALRDLLDVQLVLSHKHVWMAEAFGVPARSAYAHARAGDPERAVVEIEHGRALQLAEALERNLIEDILAREGNPLAVRLQRVSAQTRHLAIPVTREICQRSGAF